VALGAYLAQMGFGKREVFQVSRKIVGVFESIQRLDEKGLKHSDVEAS
jgi:hypothetical protein